MNTTLTKADLLIFEDNVKRAFLNREIRAPIHLNDPDQIPHLLEIFKKIHPEDWVLTTYRGHFHQLLKGVPPEELRQAILDGRSMFYCSREHRIISSAIVGGCLPIAVGLAMGIKRQGWKERVWCFVGDMAARTGAFHEAISYAGGHQLPITFVVEDNGLSTNTPTALVWSPEPLPYPDVRGYRYKRRVPHVGAGEFVSFS